MQEKCNINESKRCSSAIRCSDRPTYWRIDGQVLTIITLRCSGREMRCKNSPRISKNLKNLQESRKQRYPRAISSYRPLTWLKSTKSIGLITPIDEIQPPIQSQDYFQQSSNIRNGKEINERLQISSLISSLISPVLAHHPDMASIRCRPDWTGSTGSDNWDRWAGTWLADRHIKSHQSSLKVWRDCKTEMNQSKSKKELDQIRADYIGGMGWIWWIRIELGLTENPPSVLTNDW